MKTRLTQTVARGPFTVLGCSSSIGLVKWIDLPFIPSPGMMLGLSAESDFDENDKEVERVLYSVTQDALLVQLQGPCFHVNHQALFWEAVADYLREGWRLDPDCMLSFPNLEEAEENRTENDLLVRVGECLYLLTPDQYHVLELQGTPCRVVQREGSTTP